jgi:biopolymer transport protein ExbB
MEQLARIYDYLAQGGWIMLPLIACSLVMWGLIVDRFWFLHKLRKWDITTDEALRVLRGDAAADERPGLRAQVVREFMSQRSGDPELDREILAACAKRVRPRISRALAAIGTLAAVAPLLGLLGTVVGMVATFDVIAVFGTGNARALAGGVSVALVTTQCGLLVAIPGLLISRALERLAGRLELRLVETTALLRRNI